ncbi:metal ABC transporter permease [Roseomonas sp. PWR1]|uniref:Metal ABC transporter permease n=1 Tax=Roseomonas nitratireducens TaxID=2820810 RepID=A0ABS4AYK4_9PROT|nr:iron chelate uptake ABC transporter family permease subunit [Neoroseomonas nitratireducens]MBP0466372.1 metal ABC transporter permease [Neoroseomonas nitratireducens]
MSAVDFLRLDLPALLAAVLACGTAGLLGAFLVLRRESLLGDALSHAVLPGIIVGFALTGARAGLPMLIGALAAAMAATLLITLVRRAARIESGAATGAVFTTFFALGLVLMEVTGARSVDLDLDCVLFGQLETLVWLDATGWGSLLDPAALAGLPRQLHLLAGVAVAVGLLVTLLWRPLQILCFDPDYAAALGYPARRLELALNMAVAAAAVAAFEAVGSILVVAMLVCPAAALRLLTDDYRLQVLGSAAAGAAIGVAGYLLAGPLPAALGGTVALNAAGVIGTLGGVAVACAALLRALRRGTPRDAVAAPGA